MSKKLLCCSELIDLTAKLLPYVAVFLLLEGSGVRIVIYIYFLVIYTYLFFIEFFFIS